MSHLTSEQWRMYIKGLLSEAEQNRGDIHLQQCDQCLTLYMQELEYCSDELPELDDEEHFVQSVMEQYDRLSPSEIEHTTRRKWVQLSMHPVFHYAIAAVITIVLVGTGFFEQMAPPADWVEGAEAQWEQPSISDQLMDKTTAFIDLLNQKHDRGGN